MQPENEPQPQKREPLRVCDEAGRDLGTLRIRRALVLEVASTEVEFRCGAGGMDILIRDDEGEVFAAFDHRG